MIVSRFKDTYEEGRKLSEAQREELLAYLKGHVRATTNVGMIISAVNNIQMKDGIGDVLLEAGFKDLTGAFHHPGHGHKITLFGYEHHPNKREAPAPWDFLRKTLKKTYKGPQEKATKEAPKKKRLFG